MAEKEYIERERIKKFFDGIYDCADLTFEPNDHCCAADDCSHCKWYEAKNAIAKRILSIPAADVRPVKRGRWKLNKDGSGTCSECGFVQHNCWDLDGWDNYCHHCGAMMEER